MFHNLRDRWDRWRTRNVEIGDYIKVNEILSRLSQVDPKRWYKVKDMARMSSTRVYFIIVNDAGRERYITYNRVVAHRKPTKLERMIYG